MSGLPEAFVKDVDQHLAKLAAEHQDAWKVAQELATWCEDDESSDCCKVAGLVILLASILYQQPPGNPVLESVAKTLVMLGAKYAGNVQVVKVP